MSVSATEQVMERYFGALGTSRFAEAVRHDVTWTVMDEGRVVSGVTAVGLHVAALHASMVDSRTREPFFGDDRAVLEGDCSDPNVTDGRLSWAVVYDVRDGRVAAMRQYGRVESALV